MSSDQDPVQIIGDRQVTNPRTRTTELKGPDGNVVDVIVTSMETCGCGYSYACPGVGYLVQDGWSCKRCGQTHTFDETKGPLPEDVVLTPDPSLMAEFDRRSATPPGRHLLKPDDVQAHYDRLAAAG